MLVLVIPLGFLALLGALVAWSLRPVRTVGPTSPSQAWIAAEKHARRVVAVAWLALLASPLPLLLAASSAYRGAGRLHLGGPLLASLPLLGGIAFLAVGAVGEVTWPRPAGPVRRAPLERRRIRDVAPRGLSILAALWSVLLAVLLVVCGVAAGTGGRSLSYQHAGEIVRTSSPFPGWFYGRIVGVALVVLVAGTFAVLALIARRPPVSGAALQADAALRRTSCRRVLAGVQLVVATALAGCLNLAASAVASVEPRWADAFGPGSSVTIGGMFFYAALGLPLASAVVAVRGSGVGSEAPATEPTTGLVPA